MHHEIKQISPEYIEDYLTIYLNAYPAYKNIGDEGRNKYRPRILHSMKNDKNIHFYGLFEDGKLIAQMKLIDFSINIFGKMQKSVGLMALGVHPMHKKKGAAKEMVKFFEKYTFETGAIVAMLLPFRMDFYRKMGYGYGSKMEEYSLPTINLPQSSKEEFSKIQFIGSSQEDTSMLLNCYSNFVKQNHGMLEKFEDEIRDYQDDSDTRRVGYFENEKLMGYVTYNPICESQVNYTVNKMEVTELVYLNQNALHALLGYLRNQSDLAQKTIIRTGEPDFYHILPSAQNTSGNYIDYGFLETNISAVGTMYKIVDPATFIQTTDYRKFIPANITVHFIYTNEFEHKKEELSVEFTIDGKWKTVTNKNANVTLECTLADLSSLFMGSAGFASLVRLGAIKINNSAYIDILDLLFHTSQKPWTNTDY